MSKQDEDSPDPQGQTIERVGTDFEMLSSRIARLAIALGVDFDNHADLQRTIGRHLDQPGGSDARAWRELRGLLALRDILEKNAIDHFGGRATHGMVVEAEAHLARMGFEPGADGIDPRRLRDQ